MKNQERLFKTLSTIESRFKITFIIEKVNINNKVIYYLKRRKTVKNRFIKKNFDSYELNAFQFRLSFKSSKQILKYLHLMFAEENGFQENSEDISVR